MIYKVSKVFFLQILLIKSAELFASGHTYHYHKDFSNGFDMQNFQCRQNWYYQPEQLAQIQPSLEDEKKRILNIFQNDIIESMSSDSYCSSFFKEACLAEIGEIKDCDHIQYNKLFEELHTFNSQNMGKNEKQNIFIELMKSYGFEDLTKYQKSAVNPDNQLVYLDPHSGLTFRYKYYCQSLNMCMLKKSIFEEIRDLLNNKDFVFLDGEFKIKNKTRMSQTNKRKKLKDLKEHTEKVESYINQLFEEKCGYEAAKIGLIKHIETPTDYRIIPMLFPAHPGQIKILKGTNVSGNIAKKIRIYCIDLIMKCAHNKSENYVISVNKL